eukprot:SAG11_NODE_838_length_6918_cov_3.566945_2_plen_33_part_00
MPTEVGGQGMMRRMKMAQMGAGERWEVSVSRN